MKPNRTTSIAALLLAAALSPGASAAPVAPDDAPQAPPRLAASPREEAPPLFAELDSNHDGYISRDEAKRSAEITARFNDLDTNQDGRLSLDEVKKGLDAKPGGVPAPMPKP